MDAFLILFVVPLLLGWLLDRLIGDPERWPHPIVWFGKAVSFGEKRLNIGANRVTKGAVWSIFLILAVPVVSYIFLRLAANICIYFAGLLNTIIVFYCLAGTTLIREVRGVFKAVDQSLEAGRERVGRIVGRDTSELSEQEIRSAALETLAENLSDGVIAPLFWFMILGAPGMLMYKMINTLDSMIGYKNERYIEFGRWAAKIDDIANYIPARLTSLIMLLVAGRLNKSDWVFTQGKNHTSPNAGYPEAALAAILNCHFGGPHNYFGKMVYKPFIGDQDKTFTRDDMERGATVNIRSEIVMLALVIIIGIIAFSLGYDINLL